VRISDPLVPGDIAVVIRTHRQARSGRKLPHIILYGDPNDVFAGVGHRSSSYFYSSTEDLYVIIAVKVNLAYVLSSSGHMGWTTTLIFEKAGEKTT
jgi:hypothetical protein